MVKGLFLHASRVVAKIVHQGIRTCPIEHELLEVLKRILRM